MAVGFSNTNKPLNPRGQDASPKGFNRASLYSAKALDFDGVNDKVQCDNLDTLYSSDFTISYFFKWESTGDNWGVTQGQNGANQSIITGKQSSGVIRFAFWANDLDAPASLTPAQNEWSFLSFTYNRTTKERKIYINGILAAEDVSAANPNPTASTFQIGAFTAIGGYYNNQVSNVKVFNTALTAEQVADLYNNPEKVVPTGLESNLKLWLPMMEGAGTTAYDGSGNGNHGTIAGATYVNGIGAPVAQSAVIDWNKGQNELQYSEAFDNADWTKSRTTITANDTTAPDGSTNADKLAITTSGFTNEVYRYIGTIAIGHALSIYVKKDTARWFALGTNVQTTKMVWFDLDNGVVGTEATGYTGVMTDEGNGWYRCGIIIGTGAATSTYIDMSLTNSDGVLSGNIGLSVFIWGAQVEANDSIGAYIPTLFGTAQTSEVLLPQGLTTGRDITGVNLFENVRKQGALNLDGNSWAEVHDNESLDITDAITLEAWVYWDGSSVKGILGRWHNNASNRNYLLYKLSATNISFYINSNNLINQSGLTATKGWTHIVGTYNRTNAVLYIDGVQQATAAHTTAISTGTLPVEIGRNFTTSSQALTAPIAQPRIYNRALTASEVLRNYNSGKNTYTND